MGAIPQPLATLRTDDDTLEGNRFVNVPLHTAALQSRYYLNAVTGLSLGGTVAYVDERPANADNSITLPAYTRVDLGAYYAVTDALQLDLFQRMLALFAGSVERAGLGTPSGTWEIKCCTGLRPARDVETGLNARGVLVLEASECLLATSWAVL